MATLHGWALRAASLEKLSAGEIEVDYLTGAPKEIRDARDHLNVVLEGLLPQGALEAVKEKHLWPELLFCRWATPHVDNQFENELFLNLVLGTGPSDYYIESLVPSLRAHKDGRRMSRFFFDRASLNVGPGTIFLLDPLVPHYASPLQPHQDCLLSLLQLRLPYRSRQERARWILRMSNPDM